MLKIGITGSLASGKSTASKFLSKENHLFSADKIVKKLYSNKKLKKIIARRLKFKFNSKFKKMLKNKIIEDTKNLDKLEKIIHPLVRKEMFLFLNKNKEKKTLIFEIPLLIESNLKNFFDKIIFIKANKNLRLKRYKLNKGNMIFFSLLDRKQMKDTEKMKFCDHIVVNNKSISILKKKLSNIIKLYE